MIVLWRFAYLPWGPHFAKIYKPGQCYGWLLEHQLLHIMVTWKAGGQWGDRFPAQKHLARWVKQRIGVSCTASWRNYTTEAIRLIITKRYGMFTFERFSVDRALCASELLSAYIADGEYG